MTNLLTDRLLAAIDLHDYRHGGRPPLQATKDYIAKHGEFDVDQELEQFRRRIKRNELLCEFERRRRVQRNRWEFERQKEELIKLKGKKWGEILREFREAYQGVPEYHQEDYLRFLQDEYNMPTKYLVKISGKTQTQVKYILSKIEGGFFDGYETDVLP